MSTVILIELSWAFFYAKKPLEIKVFPISEYKRTPLQSIYAAGFLVLYSFIGF